MTTVLEAHTEMNRRAGFLAAAGLERAGADMPAVTAVAHHEDLRDADTRDQAERISQMGRKCNVYLVVQTPTAMPFLQHFGGSQLLAAEALQGRTVRTEVAR